MKEDRAFEDPRSYSRRTGARADGIPRRVRPRHRANRRFRGQVGRPRPRGRLPRASRRVQGNARGRPPRPAGNGGAGGASMVGRWRVRPRGASLPQLYRQSHGRRSVRSCRMRATHRMRRCRHSNAPHSCANSLVLLARRTAVPLVRIGLVLDAGFAADDPKRPGVSSLAMAMLDEGTTTRSALQIADELSALAARFEAGSQLDASTVSISAADRQDQGIRPGAVEGGAGGFEQSTPVSRGARSRQGPDDPHTGGALGDG